MSLTADIRYHLEQLDIHTAAVRRLLAQAPRAYHDSAPEVPANAGATEVPANAGASGATCVNHAAKYNVLLDIICRQCVITRDRLLGKSRERQIMWPRQMAQSLMVNTLKMTTFEVGAVFSVDHSAVVHNCRAVSDELSTSQAHRNNFATIKTAYTDAMAITHQPVTA